MSTLATGKRFELRGPVDAIYELWATVQQDDAKAVIISTRSENIAAIGTDDFNSATKGRSSDETGTVSLLETRTGKVFPI